MSRHFLQIFSYEKGIVRGRTLRTIPLCNSLCAGRTCLLHTLCLIWTGFERETFIREHSWREYEFVQMLHTCTWISCKIICLFKKKLQLFKWQISFVFHIYFIYIIIIKSYNFIYIYYIKDWRRFFCKRNMLNNSKHAFITIFLYL